VGYDSVGCIADFRILGEFETTHMEDDVGGGEGEDNLV
jgi:hypothetical protein